MEKTFKMKEIIIIILIVIIIGAVVMSIRPKKEHILVPVDNAVVNTNTSTDTSVQQPINLTLDEKLFTEKYVRDNIQTIATDKPVLGGSWYVTSVVANPVTHSGEVTYEDGHIQSKANFIYTYQNNPQAVTVTKFEVLK